MKPQIVNRKSGLWSFVDSIVLDWTRRRVLFIVYPPNNYQNVHPMEWLREPKTYRAYWRAALAADKINASHKKVVAIVCEVHSQKL